jgi:hypothetical protein
MEYCSGIRTSHQCLEQSNKGLLLPKFFIKYKFGTNNRQERTYEEVVKKYLDKLALVAIPNNPFQVKEVEQISKEKLLKVSKTTTKI